MLTSGGQYRWDENAISVSCAIHGCHARIVNADRCSEHGGQPTYEWHPSEWGDYFPQEVSEGSDATS